MVIEEHNLIWIGDNIFWIFYLNEFEFDMWLLLFNHTIDKIPIWNYINCKSFFTNINKIFTIYIISYSILFNIWLNGNFQIFYK